VCAARLTALAIEKARANGISCISSRNFPHTGRLGAWTTEVAEADMLGIASVAIPKIAFFGHFVVPWGGREGRFGTNPVSCAAPTAGRPIVVDMSTAAIAEGKIRAARADGSELPADRVLDAEGRPITDPNAFYGPPIGNILPFGHDFGYKAFGLMMLTALMCGSLGGEDVIGEGDHHNAMTLIAISSEAFGDRDGLRRRATELAAYVKSSAPAEGFDGVTLPGEPEYAIYEERLASGIAVPLDTTWAQICEIADEYGVGHLTKID
jgi:LDH2 family malate/lactate/ureidoglycolate dehydrogenase